ncbi:Arc family DNA-binding protein [Sphingomonas fennica]|uniref:Arc-like DNA binding domain-containing protein n=1 Tax=Edaphosphingomonas fennica TaxID=114404 RepID=A0A2T4I4J6_9SPHN|nr:Arc family DNA-binding protein [Sphingomonas fennica]PTD24421.1 hypothetical protein CV103_07365 [Sphingomonas fennica]
MARDEPLLRIRVPDELKARLERAKDDNRRSLNAEIRMRLEWSFDAGFDGGAITPVIDQASELEALRAQVRALESKLNAIPADQLQDFTELMQGLKRGEVVVLANKE